MFKKIFNVIAGIIFILLLFCGVRNTARAYRYRNLCDKYRTELNRTAETNRALNDRLGRITEVVGRLSETTERNVTDARGIIELTEELRAQVYELESSLGSFNQSEYYSYYDSYFRNEGLMD